MPRLIDVEALSARMYHDAFETDSDMQKWDSGCWIRYKMFENAIADAPTVDAEPVRHGKWLKNGDRYCECSVCHHEGNISGADIYCWYCGAKMDGIGERKEDAKTDRR